MITALLVLSAGVMGALCAPPASLADSPSLQPGVHLDPNSPAAKQYAIPLATARGATPGSGATGALFGSGISSAGGRSAGKSVARGRRGAGRSSSGRSKSGGRSRSNPAAATAIPSADKILHSGSGSALLWTLAIAALVLVIGGAGALALTDRRRGTPSPG